MGWELYETIGRLHCFWYWCLSFAPTGDLRKHNDALLAGSVGLAPKDGQRFVTSMVASGWIDRHDGIFRVHDWLEYAGRYLKDSKFKRRPEKWTEALAVYGLSADSPPTVSGMSPLPTNPPHQPHTLGDGGKRGRNGTGPVPIEEFVKLEPRKR